MPALSVWVVKEEEKGELGYRQQHADSECLSSLKCAKEQKFFASHLQQHVKFHRVWKGKFPFEHGTLPPGRRRGCVSLGTLVVVGQEWW